MSLCSTDDNTQYCYFYHQKDCKATIDFSSVKQSNINHRQSLFPQETARLRNKKKMSALNKENCDKQPRSNLAENSNVPRSQEDYITQVSEEIEGRVTKKLSQDFSKSKIRILGAL